VLTSAQHEVLVALIRCRTAALGERRLTVPEMPALTVDLRDYDALLGEVGT
jgi:hypothetical protein